MAAMNPSSEPDPWEAVTIPDLIRTECENIAGMLIEKIFSNTDPVEQLKVRIDDKLSRLARGKTDDEDTIADLIGYLILLRIAQLEPARVTQKSRETMPRTVTADDPQPPSGSVVLDAGGTPSTPAEWLRERAVSYDRDAEIAKRAGHTADWAIFISVSVELADAADMIDAGELT